MNTTLGQKVRAFRESKGLRQHDLAVAIGISQPLISAIEKGRRTPNAAMLTALCKPLGISADYLLGRAVTPASEDFVGPACLEDLSLFPEWWVLDTFEHCIPCAAGGFEDVARAE